MLIVVPVPKGTTLSVAFDKVRAVQHRLEALQVKVTWRLNAAKSAVASPPVADLTGPVKGTVRVTEAEVRLEGSLGLLARTVLGEARVEREVKAALSQAFGGGA